MRLAEVPAGYWCGSTSAQLPKMELQAEEGDSLEQKFRNGISAVWFCWFHSESYRNQ